MEKALMEDKPKKMSPQDMMMKARITAVENLIKDAQEKIAGKKKMGEYDDIKTLKELLPGGEKSLKIWIRS